MSDTVLGRARNAKKKGGSYNVFSGDTSYPSMDSPETRIPKDFETATFVDDEGNIQQVGIKKNSMLKSLLGGNDFILVDPEGNELPKGTAQEVMRKIQEWERAQYDLTAERDVGEKDIARHIMENMRKHGRR